MAEKTLDQILEEINSDQFETVETSSLEASKLNRFTKICSKIIVRTNFWSENQIKFFKDSISKYISSLGYEQSEVEIKTSGGIGSKSYINILTTLKTSNTIKKIVDAILGKMTGGDGKSVRTNLIRTLIDFELEEEEFVPEMSGVVLIADYNTDNPKIIGRYRLNLLEPGYFCNMYRGSNLRESGKRYQSADEQLAFKDNSISVVYSYKNGKYDSHYMNCVRVGSSFQIDKGDYLGDPADLITTIVGNKMQEQLYDLKEDLKRAAAAADETLKVSSEYDPELLVKSKVRVEESASVDDEQ